MDYKATLNLPKTDFPMKADLPKKEPVILEKWEKEGLYDKILKARAAGPKYILHDGPPYSNGDIHIGHALNKILKDIIVKYQTMRGCFSYYVPGWDCHGLPVEHQLFKELGITKTQIGQVEFRKKAYTYAMKYVNVQKGQFKRLGVFGDWDRPYLTLDKKYEADIVRSFGGLVKKGYIYKGLKPVNWCYVCETALAEAEVEYEEHTSPSVYVKFEVVSSGVIASPEGAKQSQKEIASSAAFGGFLAMTEPCYFIIWTTTPWTLLANVAVAVHPDCEYAFAKLSARHPERSEGSKDPSACHLLACLRQAGQGLRMTKQEAETWVMMKELVVPVMEKFGIGHYDIVKTVRGKELEGLVCRHPFVDRDSRVVLADYVSRREGTGCVHTAPGHGQEDYVTCSRYKLPVLMPVNSKGNFDSTCGEFSGAHVRKADKLIIDKLEKTGALVFRGDVTHSYPHCWRCKEPVIFRATSQWFMNIDNEGLRGRVLDIINQGVGWVPDSGRERIASMVQNRPDWCLSRQRLWGVPIAAFYCRHCGKELLNAGLIEDIAALVEEEGADAWFIRKEEELLPKDTACEKCGRKEFRKETDIIDVWFDSGVSHQAVLKRRDGLTYPSELYLEGSDQHRGWFQSALLTSMALDGTAPFRKVLTHGFVVDGEGRKMSKSLGNVVSPQDVIKDYGADILRLWVASSDYSEDVRVSEEILTRLADAYRKIRNTCRFILGNIHDFAPDRDAVKLDALLELDRWVLSETYRMLKSVGKFYEEFSFHNVFHCIYDFCVIQLSSFYLDILKDRLYIFGTKSIERRSAQTALFEVLKAITRAIAPILVFTAEEVWSRIQETSVHLAAWPEPNEGPLKKAYDKGLEEKWAMLIKVRQEVLKALELSREKGLIGSSLEAGVCLWSSDRALNDLLRENKAVLPSVFIVSSVEAADNGAADDAVKSEGLPLTIKIDKAPGAKCQRCWNYSDFVGKDSMHPSLCGRCVKIVKGENK